MNFEFFIAQRLLRGKEKAAVSVPIVKIAIAGIALGICVMLLSVFITSGFKNEITGKLSGFAAHIDITSYSHGDLGSEQCIMVSDSLLDEIRQIPEVHQVAPYITKPAILKSEAEIHGILFQGRDSLFCPDFFKQHIVQGKMPRFNGGKASSEIVLSAAAAALLDVTVGDRLAAYFVQNPPRSRMFTVAGIYDTGFREYDVMFALCDIRQLRRLNGWADNEVSGVAVELEDINDMDKTYLHIDEILAKDERSSFFRLSTLFEASPQTFDWLNLLNMNVVVILTLIIVVAGFNMVSGLLILILDKTALIGILKALGCRDISLKKIFLYLAAGLIVRGMFVGNVLAFLLGLLQYYGRFVRLDPATYYMDRVPVSFEFDMWLLLNLGVLVVSVLMVVLPTMLISRIRPIKAIRFE